MLGTYFELNLDNSYHFSKVGKQVFLLAYTYIKFDFIITSRFKRSSIAVQVISPKWYEFFDPHKSLCKRADVPSTIMRFNLQKKMTDGEIVATENLDIV